MTTSGRILVLKSSMVQDDDDHDDDDHDDDEDGNNHNDYDHDDHVSSSLQVYMMLIQCYNKSNTSCY